MTRFRKLLVLGSISLILFNSCASIQELAKIQKPDVSVEKMRITGLNFQNIDLAFDLKIDNPNPLSATLAGFDYQFFLNENSFVEGDQLTQQNIQAQSASSLEIPIRLNFKDIYQILKGIRGQDSSTYKIDCGLTFDLPILGKTRIPVSKTGKIPLLKFPKIKIAKLKLNNLSFTKANLNLDIEVDNPNAFKLQLEKLNYNFRVNGLNWAEGISANKMQVLESGKGLISIPVQLNMLQMGRTVFDLLKGNSQLEYSFSGDADMGTSLEFLKNFNLPIHKSGKIQLSK